MWYSRASGSWRNASSAIGAPVPSRIGLSANMVGGCPGASDGSGWVIRVPPAQTRASASGCSWAGCGASTSRSSEEAMLRPSGVTIANPRSPLLRSSGCISWCSCSRVAVAGGADSPWDDINSAWAAARIRGCAAMYCTSPMACWYDTSILLAMTSIREVRLRSTSRRSVCSPWALIIAASVTRIAIAVATFSQLAVLWPRRITCLPPSVSATAWKVRQAICQSVR